MNRHEIQALLDYIATYLQTREGMSIYQIRDYLCDQVELIVQKMISTEVKKNESEL